MLYKLGYILFFDRVIYFSFVKKKKIFFIVPCIVGTKYLEKFMKMHET